ncbi:hypothetical protein C1H76_8940 [Elsinoe australis]|uniref:ABM domain-containing protein n=1 Tax=Elsinoe australis TaxID=40998 RepID=A0A4U7AMK2_9PEZI|nr:hypothetical protein C1H76_8940 [Elsinoe australis]
MNLPGGLNEEDFLTELPELPQTEFCVYGTVFAHAQHADTLAAIYAETTRNAASEPGTIYYCLSRDDKDPTIFYFFERYTGKKAFDEHNSQDIIKRIFD